MILSLEEYSNESENYTGYCRICDKLTTSNVEPDALEYECEICDGYTVYGLENALIMGMIEFSK